MKEDIQKPTGKLGVLIVGLNGAVSTTFLAGTLAINKKLAKPIGSLTQMATIRIGKRNENNFPLIKDLVPLADLNDMVFGGWDIRDESCFDSAMEAQVLHEKDLLAVRKELDALRPFPAVFEQKFVVNLHGDFVKKENTKFDLAEKVREDIRNFKKKNNCDRLVTIWCGSTEIYMPVNGELSTLEGFEKGLKENHSDIAPSMIYAYASIAEGVPYINGAPNLSVDLPALVEFSHQKNVPVAGKDFKTGQTMVKTVIAPMLKARMLGLNGWFSTNILGNRDGEVLDDPNSFKTKEVSKLSVLDSILQPTLYPDLYKEHYHKVRINYYPPRGDNKEGWDNIDIFGWLGYEMQMKIDFLCKDSILAAPIVLDLILLMDLAKRSNLSGIQEWLSFYFKSPMHADDVVPEHDLFIQLMKMKNTLRELVGVSPVTHTDKNNTPAFTDDIDMYS
jgi:myo-inositol-1-phosphate synthase